MGQQPCLENPRDGGAWWAAVYGVAQSRTWLKRLSSSSSSLTRQGSTRKYCLWGTHARWSTENLSSESSWVQTWLWHLLSGCLCKICFTSLRVSLLIYEMEIIVPSSKIYGWGLCELGCSVAKLCATLCDPMNCSMPGFPVFHCLPEFAQIHILEWVVIFSSRASSQPRDGTSVSCLHCKQIL